MSRRKPETVRVTITIEVVVNAASEGMAVQLAETAVRRAIHTDDSLQIRRTDTEVLP